MALSVPIISEFVDKGIKRAIAEFKQLETTGEKAQFALQKAALPAAAALGALTVAAGASVKKAMEAEAAQARLATILQTTGGATALQVRELERQAKALEKVGVASGGNITVLQSQLATFDLQYDTISRLTPAIADYVIAEKGATAGAEDFKNMTNSLAQALQGNFTALTKSGFVLDDQTKKLISSGSESQRAAALVQVLNSTYKDFNKTARETAEGRMVALRNAMDSAQESIGRALLPTVERIIPVLERFANFVERNTTLVVVMGTVVAGLSVTVLGLNAAFKIYQATQVLVTVWNSKIVASTLATDAALKKSKVGWTLLAVAAGAAMTVKVLDWMFPVTKAAEQQTKQINELANAYQNLHLQALTGKKWLTSAEIMARAAGNAIQGPDLTALPIEMQQRRKAIESLMQTYGKTWAEAEAFYNKQNKAASGSAKAIESYSSRFKAALENAVENAQRQADQIKSAMSAFADSVRNAILEPFTARQALDAGQETGGGFLSGLQQQAQKVGEYGKRVEGLLKAGLSKDALAMVLDSGIEAGTQIADELIAGGEAAIAETNRLVMSAKEAATKIGVYAGENYFAAGLEFAQKVVAGLEQKLRELTPQLMRHMDALAKRLKRTVDIDVRINQIIGSVTGGVGIPKFGDGGIVSRATLAVVGEKGPEAIVPLDQLGGMGTTINIYSTIADESLPEKLVQALRTYNRTTGPVRIQVI